jgi:hypothetical protein
MASLQDDDVVTIHQVDKTMFLANPPRPTAGQGMPERLRFANADCRIPKNSFYEPVDPLER